MNTSDQTRIDANEQAFDLEELVHVEETCVFLFISFKAATRGEIC